MVGSSQVVVELQKKKQFWCEIYGKVTTTTAVLNCSSLVWLASDVQ
jgi:hypothetical protein